MIKRSTNHPKRETLAPHIVSTMLVIVVAALGCGSEVTVSPDGGAGGDDGAGGAGGDDGAGGDGLGGGSPAMCGDGIAQSPEPCDGADLNGYTCESGGFSGGDLTCTPNCQIDTSECTKCGNGALDAGEVCDGELLGDETCVGLGFDVGMLACGADCLLDTSACTFANCGDATVEGGESCDGPELEGATCETEGFTQGALACALNCTFDTSGCTLCGDGILGAPENCDVADFGGETCAGLGFTAGTLGCSDGCAFDTTLCSSLPHPSEGNVIVDEIMKNPTGPDATIGEWFEVINASSTETYELGGCVVDNELGDSFVIEGTLPIGPHETIALANITSPGFAPSYVYPSVFSLADDVGSLRLSCGSGLVDEVEYDDHAFPHAEGRSMSLEATMLSNELASWWCPAPLASPGFTTGDLGSPGAPNSPCAPVNIGFCRLESPIDVVDFSGTPTTMRVRVYAPGLTDLTTGNDPSAPLIGEFAWVQDGVSADEYPFTSYFDPAVPTIGWDGAAAGEPDVDQYEVTVPLTNGTWDFTFRFAGNYWWDWVFCDGGTLGSADGYQAENAGQLYGAPRLWINEIHYDNEGADTGEGLEIAGLAGTPTGGYSVYYYYAAGLAHYAASLGTGTMADQGNGYGTRWVPIPNLPDGVGGILVARSNAGNYRVESFLCYGGPIATQNGPASEWTTEPIPCTVLDVAEEPPSPSGSSLQLVGAGRMGHEFTWSSSVPSTPGSFNVGQTFQP